MEKDAAIYVRHILEAITNIETDTAGYDFEKFRADRRTRQLVERNLEILSEASRRLPEELKLDEARIPWRAIAGPHRNDVENFLPALNRDISIEFRAKNDLAIFVFDFLRKH